MGKLIHLQENIKIADYVKAEKEIGAIIYRQQYEKHRAEYFCSKTDSELIFTFILLQIYIECFLHQNMRRIVELEFKPPRESICIKWFKKEKRHIPEKIDNFPELFFTQIPTNIGQYLSIIKQQFKKLSDIRNLFAHGHKVSEWSDSDGKSGITIAKSMLTEIQLIKTEQSINELGIAWDKLLDEISPKCKALKRIEDFKLPIIKPETRVPQVAPRMTPK